MIQSPLLDVLSGRKPARRPIWFMRQAGRYLPEYRALREKAGSFLNLCYAPELAAEVTLQPLKRFDLDAAILFADILVVPHAMGLELRFEEGEGPVLATVSDMASVMKLKPVAGTSQVSAVCGTIKAVRLDLAPAVGLIGFCGGPWTVASYMVEGGSSERIKSRIAAYERFDWFENLIDRLIVESIDYLSAQIEAGVQAVQIFDSWAGELTCGLRERYVVQPLARMCAELGKRHPATPVIVFARGAGVGHGQVARECGAAAVGIESEADIGDILAKLPGGVAIQGNLDPVALLASEAVVKRETLDVVRRVPMGRHIFNLGHGIKPMTDLGNVAAAIAAVRDYDRLNPHG